MSITQGKKNIFRQHGIYIAIQRKQFVPLQRDYGQVKQGTQRYQRRDLKAYGGEGTPPSTHATGDLCPPGAQLWKAHRLDLLQAVLAGAQIIGLWAAYSQRE
eukprot:c1645_g1_i1 orf=1-306(+)